MSTKAICDWVSEYRGAEIRVLTTDAAGPDCKDNLILEKKNITMAAGYCVTYYPRIAKHSISPALLANLYSAIRWADVVHITGTYSFPTLPALAIARLRQKPVIWSLRGAVQASAEWSNAPSRRIKRIFERVAQFIAPRDTVLHVTAESEASATSKRLAGMTLLIIPNSVEIPEDFKRVARADRNIRMMFISRLHEKKGLSLLFKAMLDLPSHFTLDIYGTGEEDFVSKLKAQVVDDHLTKRIRFHGHVDGEQKSAAFKNADLFVLPSYSENFGIVIAEALAHRLPVVTTTRTPWTALEKNGCGRCVEPEIGPIRSAILDVSQGDFVAMGERGHAWMRAEFSFSATHSVMYDAYRSLVLSNGTAQAKSERD